MNNVSGMGFVKIPPPLFIFLPFYVQAFLPKQIKLGEILSQNFSVTSNLNGKQTVTLTVSLDFTKIKALNTEADGWKSEKFL